MNLAYAKFFGESNFFCKQSFGLYWTTLDISDHLDFRCFWTLLDAIGRFWTLLYAVGSFNMIIDQFLVNNNLLVLLDAFGSSWKLFDAFGPC